MLNTIKLLIGIIIFTFFAAILFAIIQHLYALLVYRFQLWDDWYYFDAEIGFFFREGLLIYGIADICFGFAILLIDFFTDMPVFKYSKYVLLGCLVMVELAIVTITNRFIDFFTLRAFIQTLIFFIPALFVKYFLWGMVGKSRNLTKV